MFRVIRYIVYAFSGILLGGLIFEAVTLPHVGALQNENPATTSMIETRIREAERNGVQPKRVQIWVPLEKISPQLQRAALAGEDTNFAMHHGLDYEHISHARNADQKLTANDA